MRFNRFMLPMFYLMAEAGAEGGEGGGGADPAAAGSLLSTGGEPPAAATGTDYIPEKYRVSKEDGTLDLEQSSRKLAESYSHLEKRFGSGDAPPKTAEEYAPKIEVEGFDWDEFKSDDNAKSFLKGAHAKGMTNAQVEFAVGEYLKMAPGLIEGAAQLTAQDATEALRGHWKTDQDMSAGVKASYRAVQAFANEGEGVGSLDKLMSKYGNDPDFVAFAANIGKELREDVPVAGNGQASGGDFDVKTSELRSELQALPAHDPKRKVVQGQLDALYASRYPSGSSRLK